MSIFETVTLRYKDQTKSVEPEKVLKLLAVIEQSVDFSQSASNTWPCASMGIAIAKVYRYVGIKVSDEELAQYFAANKAKMYETIKELADLINMLSPPEPAEIQESESEETDSEKKDEA